MPQHHIPPPKFTTTASQTYKTYYETFNEHLLLCFSDFKGVGVELGHHLEECVESIRVVLHVLLVDAGGHVCLLITLHLFFCHHI